MFWQSRELYRRAALDRLSAPDALDEPHRLLTVRDWVPPGWTRELRASFRVRKGRDRSSEVRTGLRQGRVRTPSMLQMEVAECGAAALGIVLGYYGRFVPLAELRRACGVSRDGSTALNILQAARSFGLIADGFTKQLEQLHELSYPFVAFWNFNHFVVVEGCRRGRVFLNDPATGPRTVLLEEFDHSFTGVALTFEPDRAFVKAGWPPSPVAGLWHRVRPFTRLLLVCTSVSLLLALPGIVIARLLQTFVDTVLIQGFGDRARPVLIGLVLATVFSALLTAIQLRLLRHLRLRLAARMAGQFVRHLLRLPADFYMQRYSGEIAGRIALNERAADLLSGRLAVALVSLLLMIAYATALVRLDWILAAVAVTFAAAHLAILQAFARHRVDGNRRLAQEYDKVWGTLVAGLRSIRTIKASGLEGDLFAKLAGQHAAASNAHQAVAVAQLSIGLVPRFLSSVMSASILVIGGLRVIDGTLTIGMLVASQVLARSFLAPVATLMRMAGSVQDLQGALARLDDVLSNPRRAHAPAELCPGTSGRDGHLVVRDLRFRYSLARPPFIDRFHMTAAAGQRIALVGRSGSGKSTIARLIAGIYEPLAGVVQIDGIPRAAIPPRTIARTLAFVDQDTHLFAGTVRDNLTLWDRGVPFDRIVAACRDTALHDDIEALPNGYETRLLEEGINLSGGQRQRLELARALCGDPSVLVLDEATSALDTETEHRITENLRRRGCTCVIVAHRLSTIRDADEIIVLDGGRVVQRGTHDSLLSQGGAYEQLVKAGESALTDADARNQR